MKRQFAALLVASMTVSLGLGCSGSSSSDAKSIPISTKEGADKKGHKTKSIEASLEEPPVKK